MPRASFEEVRAGIIQCVGRVLPGLMQEFETQKRDDHARATSVEFQFAGRRGELAEDGGPAPVAAIKFLLHAARHIDKFKILFPHIEDAERSLEIGPGPGYLLKIMRDCFGADAFGVDVPVARTYVYGVMRKELGVDACTLEHVVEPRQPIPLVEGRDLIVGYLPAFHSAWTADDHRWLWDFCRERMAGAKKLVFVFNRPGFTTNDDVHALYRRHAEFPLQRKNAISDLFCVVRL